MSNAVNTSSSSIEKPIEYVTNSKVAQGQTLTTQDLHEMQSALCNPSKFSLRLPTEIWPDLKKEIMSRTDKPRYPIGLPTLDNVLWGLHKKQMMAIGARTSQGKTAFALYLAKRMVERSQKVVYFSLEMSRQQMLERLFTQVVRINNRDLRQGQANDKVIENESFFKTWMENVRLLIDDKYGYEFDNILQILHMVRPDFVFIDYIQMISARGHRTKLDAIEEYVRKLMQLAIDLDFGAVVVSQINRSGVEQAELHNFKHAGVLEEHPDTVITLKWDWSEEDPGKFIVDVKKQRHGEPRNNLIIKFVPQHSIFEEREEAKLF